MLGTTDLWQNEGQSGPFFRFLIEQLPVGVFQADTDGRCLYVNKAWETLSGISAEASQGYGWTRCVHPDDLPALQGVTRMAMQEGKPFQEVRRLVRPDGEVRYVRFEASPFCLNQTEVAGFIGVATDITEQIVAEQRLHALVESLDDLVLEVDDSMRLLNVWADNERDLFFSKDQLMGQPMWEFMQTNWPDETRLMADAVEEALRIQSAVSYEYASILPGDDRWYSAKVSPILEGGQSTNRVTILIRNITARKKAEAGLQEMKQWIDSSPEGIQVSDESGRLVYANTESLSRLGYSLDELRTKYVWEFEKIFEAPGSWEAHVEEVKNQGSLRVEGVNWDITGREFPVEVNVRYVRSGDQGYIVAFSRDITFRREAEAAVRQKEAYYRQILNAIPDLILVKDQQNQPTWANEPFMRFMGNQDVRQWAERPDLFTPDTALMDRYVLVTGQSVSIEAALARHDGIVRQFQTIKNPIYDEGEKITQLVEVSRDITDMVQVQETLVRKDRLLSAVARSTELFLAEKSFEHAMHQALTILGQYSDVDRVYLFENHYNERADVWEASQRFEWNSGTAEPQIDNPDLQNIPFSAIQDFVNPLLRRQPLVGLVKNFSGSLKELLESQAIVSIITVPIYLEEQFWGFVGFDDCRLERVWTEAEQAVLLSFANSVAAFIKRLNQDQHLIRAKEAAEKANRAKSEFLSVMSHEIRTPLNAVIGMTHLLLEDNPLPGQQENLKTLHFSAENLLVLINDILDYSKIEAGKVEFERMDFDLRQLVSNIKQANQVRAEEKGIRLRLMIDDDVPSRLVGDPVRLGQVLNNLVSNGVKFTEEGTVTIEVSQAGRDAQNVQINFSVSDTGLGIPADKHQLIFEKFAQADSQITRRFGGTGLGLSITKKLLELQQSHIELQSEEGKGSRFSFTLSLGISTEKSPAEPKAYSKMEDKNLHGMRILIAEDNRMNVFVAEKFLSKWNVVTQVAENGAVAVAMTEAESFDMILMDLQMPEMDGYEATRRIRAFNKTIPILAVSASPLYDIQVQAIEAGMNDYVTKPFNPADLYQKIVRNRLPLLA